MSSLQGVPYSWKGEGIPLVQERVWAALDFGVEEECRTGGLGEVGCGPGRVWPLLLASASSWLRSGLSHLTWGQVQSPSLTWKVSLAHHFLDRRLLRLRYPPSVVGDARCPCPAAPV